MDHETYLDAVLDSNMNPLFNGTTEQTVEWLCSTAEDWKMQQNAQVCVGRTLQLKTIDEYLRDYDTSQKIHGL